MKKIRCPHCAVINMEKFVTFPYCAGCGARLPAESKATSISPWRKPLGLVLWSSILGVTLLTIFAAVRVFDVADEETSRVILMARAPQNVAPGDTFTVRLQFKPDERTRLRVLRDVQIRLLRANLTHLNLASVQPPPTSIQDMGSGRYLNYESLAPTEEIRLQMRADETPGRRALQMRCYAARQLQGVASVAVRVIAPTKP